MGRALYLCGVVAIAIGAALLIPTISRVGGITDSILLLGTPLVMNGVMFCIYGVLLLSIGKVVALLNKIASGQEVGSSSRRPLSTDWLESSEGESRVLIDCPNCLQPLRVPMGKKGTLKCPNCHTAFEAET